MCSINVKPVPAGQKVGGPPGCRHSVLIAKVSNGIFGEINLRKLQWPHFSHDEGNIWWLFPHKSWMQSEEAGPFKLLLRATCPENPTTREDEPS